MRNIELFLLFFTINEILCSFEESNFISKDSNGNEIAFGKNVKGHDNVKTDYNGPFMSYAEKEKKTSTRGNGGYFWLFLIMFLSAVITAILFICLNKRCLKKQKIKEKKKQGYKNV